MKRSHLICLALTLALLSLLLIACGQGDVPDDPATEAPDTEAVTETEAPETTTEAPAPETEPPKEEKKLKTNPNDPDFFILYTDGEVDFSKAPKAYVNIYRWGQSYMPVTYGQIVFKEGDGFYVRMETEETNPRAVNTQRHSSVCQDSCLEFFAVYDPANSMKYINIEMNAIGTWLCYFCESNKVNNIIEKSSDSLPEIEPFKTETTWGTTLHVPLDMIEDCYPGVKITEGSTILMNFYKCGDKTDKPHWGAWSEVETEKPNFHVPQYFSEVEIRKAN